MAKATHSTSTPAPRVTPEEVVLVDLLGGADFDHEILNPAEAARIVIERLRDAGFEIVPAVRS
jgi:hypothetical protein